MTVGSRPSESEEMSAPERPDASARDADDAEHGEAPPPYDPSAVGRVAARVEIEAVELVRAHFHRDDDAALPSPLPPSEPEFGANAEWSLSNDTTILGCLVTFGVSPEPDHWTLIATYRLIYRLRDGETLAASDLKQFAHWNAVFNAWPYWRELLGSTLWRAGLPPVLAPVLGVPRSNG